MKLAVNPYYDIACVMLSARMMGLSVYHHYADGLHYGASPGFDVSLYYGVSHVMMLPCYSLSC